MSRARNGNSIAYCPSSCKLFDKLIKTVNVTIRTQDTWLKFIKTGNFFYIAYTVHFIASLIPTNTCTRLLTYTKCIWDLGIWFSKRVAIFRGFLAEYKSILHQKLSCSSLLKPPWRWQLVCWNICRGLKYIFYMSIILWICWFILHLTQAMYVCIR